MEEEGEIVVEKEEEEEIVVEGKKEEVVEKEKEEVITLTVHITESEARKLDAICKYISAYGLTNGEVDRTVGVRYIINAFHKILKDRILEERRRYGRGAY